MAVLEVKELTKKYGQGESEVTALDHVSFSVERGEFVAIIGASGSGKSTLMNLIGGIDHPTSGSVMIVGNDHCPPHLLRQSCASPQVGRKCLRIF